MSNFLADSLNGSYGRNCRMGVRKMAYPDGMLAQNQTENIWLWPRLTDRRHRASVSTFMQVGCVTGARKRADGTLTKDHVSWFAIVTNAPTTNPKTRKMEVIECKYYKKGRCEYHLPYHRCCMRIVKPLMQCFNYELKKKRQWTKDLAQYVNKPMIFKSCKFENFSPRRGFTCKQYFTHENK